MFMVLYITVLHFPMIKRHRYFIETLDVRPDEAQVILCFKCLRNSETWRCGFPRFFSCLKSQSKSPAHALNDKNGACY